MMKQACDISKSSLQAKRSSSRLLWIAAFSILVAGCVDNKVRLEIERLRSDLEDSRGFQAEQTTKISTLETDLRKISGRVDEIEFQQNQRLGNALNNIKNDLTSLRRRVPPPPIVPANELEEDEDKAAEVSGELAVPLAEALGAIREGSFEKALQNLDQASGPALDTEWMPSLLFWQGVCHEGRNELRLALESYIGLNMKFSKYKRAPLAMYRQASVMLRLGDKKAARIVLGKLVADYPKSSEAARAKDKLKDLGR